MSMTMRAFIRKNKSMIIATIRGECSNLGHLTEEDIEDWITNVEPLYLWAKREGVQV